MIELLGEHGPLDRPAIESQLGIKPRNSTLTRALKHGIGLAWLVKEKGESVGQPTQYALAPPGAET